MSEYSTINAVSRAFRVIEVLSDAPDGASVSEIAERADIEFSIASRILSTLASDGYVQRDESTGRYRISHRLVAAITRHVDGTGFPDICMPLLQEMADRCGELVQLAVLEGGDFWYIAKAEGKHRIRMLSALGRVAPLHASSVGKAFLASLPEEEALAMVAARGMPPITNRTITTLPKLKTELRKVRAQGYAIVDEEYVEGGTAVGALVRLERLKGAIVGAVSIAGPSFRVKGPVIKELARETLGLAERMAAVWPVHRAPLVRMSA
jgi:DNA-binding IclR family transcriptional regulator